MSELRPAAVEQVARLLRRRFDEGELPERSDDAEAWAARYEWASPEELSAGYAQVLAPLRALLDQFDAQRRREQESGLDDWAWCFTHGIAFDRWTG